MEIILPLDVDSDNSQPGKMNIRRGLNRPKNLVIEVDSRELEVNMEDMCGSLSLLNGSNVTTLIDNLRSLQKKSRNGFEWESIAQVIKIVEREL